MNVKNIGLLATLAGAMLLGHIQFMLISSYNLLLGYASAEVAGLDMFSGWLFGGFALALILILGGVTAIQSQHKHPLDPWAKAVIDRLTEENEQMRRRITALELNEGWTPDDPDATRVILPEKST